MNLKIVSQCMAYVFLLLFANTCFGFDYKVLLDGLCDAEMRGDKITAQRLCSELLTMNEDGNTAAHVIAVEGSANLVKFFIEKGVDFNAPNDRGDTPLIFAARHGNIDFVKQLLALTKINVNAFNNKQVTALLEAAAAGHKEIVEVLLNQPDIKVNIPACNGSTAVDDSQHQEIAQLLLQRGGVAFLPLTQKLKQFVDAINTQNYDVLATVISSRCFSLKKDILALVAKGMTYGLDVSPFAKNVDFLNQNKIKVHGIFDASGQNWEMEGYSTYFVFEKENNEWVLTSTDFASKFDTTTLIYLGLSMLIFLIVMVTFYFWMLVDCIRRDFNKRLFWTLMLIIFNIFAAVIYFFLVKRRNIKNVHVCQNCCSHC